MASLTLLFSRHKLSQAALEPGGATAVDDEVDRGIDSQKQVVCACQAEEDCRW